jgi:hypothetical protein
VLDVFEPLTQHRRSIARVIVSVLIAISIPQPVTAEVSDKIVSIPTMWLWILAGSVAGFVAWARGWRVGVLVTPVTLLPSLVFLSEVLDPHVGRAIWREQGLAYVATAFAAPAAVILSAILGWQLKRRVGSRPV